MKTATINGNEYKLQFTMLSLVRAKALVGEDFFKLAAPIETDDPAVGMEKALRLALLALQAHHGDTFKSIEDVAAQFATFNDLAGVIPVVNEALSDFLTVDASLQKRLSDATNANAKKKTPRSKSPKTNSAPSAESVTASAEMKP